MKPHWLEGVRMLGQPARDSRKGPQPGMGQPHHLRQALCLPASSLEGLPPPPALQACPF